MEPHAQRYPMRKWLWRGGLLHVHLCSITRAIEFHYRDFNATLGLTLNGDVAITHCVAKPENFYSTNYSVADDPVADLPDIQVINSGWTAIIVIQQ